MSEQNGCGANESEAVMDYSNASRIYAAHASLTIPPRHRNPTSRILPPLPVMFNMPPATLLLRNELYPSHKFTSASTIILDKQSSSTDQRWRRLVACLVQIEDRPGKFDNIRLDFKHYSVGCLWYTPVALSLNFNYFALIYTRSALAFHFTFYDIWGCF